MTSQCHHNQANSAEYYSSPSATKHPSEDRLCLYQTSGKRSPYLWSDTLDWSGCLRCLDDSCFLVGESHGTALGPREEASAMEIGNRQDRTPFGTENTAHIRTLSSAGTGKDDESYQQVSEIFSARKFDKSPIKKGQSGGV